MVQTKFTPDCAALVQAAFAPFVRSRSHFFPPPGTCPDIQPVAGKPPWPTGPSGTVPTTSVPQRGWIGASPCSRETRSNSRPKDAPPTRPTSVSPFQTSRKEKERAAALTVGAVDGDGLSVVLDAQPVVEVRRLERHLLRRRQLLHPLRLPAQTPKSN